MPGHTTAPSSSSRRKRPPVELRTRAAANRRRPQHALFGKRIDVRAEHLASRAGPVAVVTWKSVRSSQKRRDFKRYARALLDTCLKTRINRLRQVIDFKRLFGGRCRVRTCDPCRVKAGKQGRCSSATVTFRIKRTECSAVSPNHHLGTTHSWPLGSTPSKHAHRCWCAMSLTGSVFARARTSACGKPPKAPTGLGLFVTVTNAQVRQPFTALDTSMRRAKPGDLTMPACLQKLGWPRTARSTKVPKYRLPTFAMRTSNICSQPVVRTQLPMCRRGSSVGSTRTGGFRQCAWQIFQPATSTHGGCV